MLQCDKKSGQWLLCRNKSAPANKLRQRNISKGLLKAYIAHYAKGIRYILI